MFTQNVREGFRSLGTLSKLFSWGIKELSFPNVGSVYLLKLNHDNRCEQRVLFIAVIYYFNLNSTTFNFMESFLFSTNMKETLLPSLMTENGSMR